MHPLDACCSYDGWHCWVQDATGRYKNERVQYMRLCETETEAPPEEKALPPPTEPAKAAAAPAAAAAAAGAAATAPAAGAAAAGEGAAVKAEADGGDAAMAEAPSAAAAAAAEGVQAEGEAQAAAAAVAEDAEMAEAAPSSPGAAATPDTEAAAEEGAAEGAAEGAEGGVPSAEKAGLAAEVAALNITVSVPPAAARDAPCWVAGWLVDWAGCCQMHSWSNQLSAASCTPGGATTSFTRPAKRLPVSSPPTPHNPCCPPHPRLLPAPAGPGGGRQAGQPDCGAAHKVPPTAWAAHRGQEG
jgi:hypothetical protein